MELYICDKALNLLGVVDEISALVWTRRYWSCGEFSLLIPMTDRHAGLIQTGRIIIRRDADEAGQIKYIQIQRDANGLEQIEIQGRFLTHWIGNRVITPMISMKAPTHTILHTIVRDNLVSPADARRALPTLDIDTIGAIVSGDVNFTSTENENALEACEDRAKLAKLGFKITTDLNTKRHCFVVYQGLDRTSSQTANPICIFSPEMDNVLEQEFVNSEENLASAVYVGGATSQDKPRRWAEVSDDTRTGVDRIEVVYDANDVAQTYTEDGEEKTVPDEEYLGILRERGERSLEGKKQYIAFRSSIDTQANHRYKQDYDLGDRVTCINRRWKISIDLRITEIVESYESGKVEIEVTFGESTPTLSETIRWR